jgi:hypothetical protein
MFSHAQLHILHMPRACTSYNDIMSKLWEYFLPEKGKPWPVHIDIILKMSLAQQNISW